MAMNTKFLQPNWSAIEVEETRILRNLTIAESVKQYVALRHEFEPWLQSTTSLFAQARNDAIITLQQRLTQINKVSAPSMDSLISGLIRLQQRLEEAGLPSMVIGGVAVGIWVSHV